MKYIGDAWYVANLWITANEKILLVLLNGLAILVAIGLWVSAQKQIKTAEDIAHKQLRAYITVVEPFTQTPEFLDDRVGDRLEASFFIINSGQTPASEVKDSTYIEVRPKNAKLVMPNGTDQFRQFAVSANARQDREAKSVEALSKEQITGIKSGDLRIFLRGKIAYKDIFNEYHRTEFCFEYDFEQKKFQSYSNYDRTR